MTQYLLWELEAGSWRLTNCLLPTENHVTRVATRVEKLTVEDVTASIQPSFPFVDVKNFTA